MVNFTNLRRNFLDYVRGALRGHPGVRLGRGVKLGGPGRYDLHRGVTITAGARLWVGPGATFTMMPGSKLGDRTIVNVETNVYIGRSTRVSWDVQILDTDFHWVRTPDGRVRPHTKPIALGDQVLVGSRAMILKGVEVGDGAVIGAGSVVRRSVLPGVIVAGNPAQHVGEVVEWGSARGEIPADRSAATVAGEIRSDSAAEH